MHEKTLLYGALGFTAIAAIFGVYKAKSEGPRIEITPVSLIDSSKNLTAAEVPVRLTASDGTGLRLVALRAEAAAAGGRAPSGGHPDRGRARTRSGLECRVGVLRRRVVGWGCPRGWLRGRAGDHGHERPTRTGSPLTGSPLNGTSETPNVEPAARPARDGTGPTQ